MKTELTQGHVCELLDYDPLTGDFTWRERSRHWFPTDRSWKWWNTNFANKKAGTKKDYHYFYFLGKNYLGHRLAWIYMTGAWPEKDIDHKDCDGSNNKWDNLREASSMQNMANSRAKRGTKTGAKGVTPDRLNKAYRAAIRINGKNAHLGTFKTIDEANLAYFEAAKEHFGEFARAG